MNNHSLWRFVDVVAGLVLAGVLAPLTLMILPAPAQGPWTVLATALVTIAVVMAVRPRLVGPR